MLLVVEDSALPPRPQPSASTSISCDNLQTEDQLAAPPTPGLGSTPAPPRPPLGPQLREAPAECNSPRPPLRPGPVGQIKPLSHTPRKAQGQMGQDKWCQIIDPGRPGLGKGPTTAPHMAVGGGKGALGGAATEQHGREMTHHGHPGDGDHARDPCSAAG